MAILVCVFKIRTAVQVCEVVVLRLKNLIACKLLVIMDFRHP